MEGGCTVRFLTKLLGQWQVTPGDSAPLAKERLKLALTYDRNGLEQGAIDELRGELIAIMAKRLDISTDDVQVDIDDTAGPNKLVASIALRPPRRPRATVASAELS